MKRIVFFLALTAGLLFSAASMATGLGFFPPELATAIGIGGGTFIKAQTIVLTDLKTDFGTYISNNKKQIYKLLVQPTESQKYMTTIAKTITEYRAGKATIGNVVQGFTTTFNDKGQAEFTPIVIQNRRHKINLSLTPDEIIDSWIGFMADNEKQRKDYPIVKYIIEELVLPKVQEDRELLLIGKGEYDANNLDVTGKSMDGFVTTLTKKKELGTSNINFIDLDAITDDNVVKEVEKFGDNISQLYKSVSMNVYIDPDLHIKYLRKKRDAYGQHVDYAATNRIDFTNLTLVPLPSMIGTGVMFSTTKQNFIRLINRNDGATNMWIETDKYDVLIFADWWEAVGFAIEEAVFAYVPDAESGSSGQGV